MRAESATSAVWLMTDRFSEVIPENLYRALPSVAATEWRVARESLMSSLDRDAIDILRPMASHAPIPLFDLSRETADIRSSLDRAIGRVLDAGRVIMSSEHDAIEEEFAAYVGVRNAIGVANGTDALEIALAVVGVRAGDTIITVANAGGYASLAARRLGAVPVYCDVDASNLLMSAATLEACLAQAGSKPSAIVVTHLFGAMVDMPAVMLVAERHGIPVVEDCAQSMGARLEGQMCGSFGEVATTSFYPTKNLGALGDGGMIFTSNDELADRARSARQYGWSTKYHVAAEYGRNSRLDEIQAAILRVKLPLLDAAIERRKAVYQRYLEANANLFVNANNQAFAPHLAVMRVTNRAAVMDLLRSQQIGCDIHYPVLDHQQPAWRTKQPTSLPVSELAVQEIVSVPMFPHLTDAEVDHVCAALQTISE